MIRYLTLFAALIAPALSVPAHAADPATLACIDEQLGDGGSALVADQIRGIVGDLDGKTSDQKKSDDGATALGAAVKLCAEKHHWSPDAAEAAALYAMPHIGWGTAAEIARSRGLDAAAIEKTFRGLSVEEQLSVVSPTYEFNKDAATRVALRLIAAGQVKEENAETAGGLIALLALRERAVHNFAGY